MDFQSSDIASKVPTLFPVVVQDRLHNFSHLWIPIGKLLGTGFQCLNDAVTHLEGRFPGKGYGENFFRRGNQRQQGQITPDQQAGLA